MEEALFKMLVIIVVTFICSTVVIHLIYYLFKKNYIKKLFTRRRD